MINYEVKYKELLDRIKNTRRKETSVLFINGLLQSLYIAISALFLIVLIEFIAKGDSNFRTILVVSVFTIFGVALVYYALPAFLRALGVKNNPSEIDIALRIGEKFPDLRDNLCNALQLIPISKDTKGTSSQLIFAAFDSISKVADEKNFDVIIDNSKIKRNLIVFLLVSILSFGLIGAFNSSLGESLYRLANFRTSFIPPAPFTIKIENKFISKFRGESVQIKIYATGVAPSKIVLNIKEAQQENFDKITLKLDNNYYKYDIPSVKNSMTFFGEAIWMNSSMLTEVGTLKIIDKPIIRSLSGKVVFPGYTGEGTKSFNEQTADLTALKGSRIQIQSITNKDIDSAFICFEEQSFQIDTNKNADGNKIKIFPMKVNDRSSYGEFNITNSGKYWIKVVDKDQQTNESPIQYSILALNDEMPSISLIEPKFDVQITSDAILPIKVSISDDYGFSSLKLFYRLAESPYTTPDKTFKSLPMNFTKGENNSESSYVWDLNKFGISPEDKYEFYCEVTDNDIISGPKSSKTQTISVRLPSVDEVLKDNEIAQQNIEKDLEKVLKEAKELKNNIDELNRDLMKDSKKKELDWKDKKKAEDIAKKQQELGEKLEKIKENLENATEKLENNNLISEETLEKYKELQNLMEKVNSPEFKKMQQKMQDAMKNMSPEDMKKAMEEFKFSEEQFRKSIERTMKILKRIQAEQKADALTKRAEDIKKRQEESEKNNSQNKETAAKQQEKLNEDLDKMKDELKELEDLMKEIGEEEMPMDELKEAKDELDADKTSQEMKQAQQDMEKGDMKSAKEKQKNANKKLDKFAQQMQKVREKMKKKNTQEAIKQMEKNINNLLELSKKQEKLKNNTSKSEFNSTRLPQMAKEQAESFESLANIANSMMQLGEKSFAITPEMAEQIGNALNDMKESVEQLADRQPSSSAQSQQSAMSSMNKAIGQMQQMVGNMKKNNGSCSNPGGSGEGEGEGSGGKGMGQKMQQMAAQQQAINQAMQQMAQGGRGGSGMSQEQQAQMKKLSEQQGGMQKSVQELINEQKQYAAGDKNKLDELNKLAKEMKESMNDMRSSGIKDETMKRQEKILSRLLDLTKSVNERDFEKNRESKTGKDFNLSSPSEINFKTQEGRQQALREFLKKNSKDFTKDYENMIRTYYELIEKMKN